MTIKQYRPFAALQTLFIQLWLSVSSVDFYEDVRKHYSGYGIKYLLTITFISSVLYCIIPLSYLNNIQDYFTYNKISRYTIDLDYIIKQMPDLSYDGKDISIKDDEALYLYGMNGSKVGVIDPKNTLNYKEKSKIPIIFTADKILISFIWVDKRVDLPISYNIIFGNNEQELSRDKIRHYLSQRCKDLSKIYIYFLMPMIIGLSFANIMLKVVFSIAVIYSLTRIFASSISFRTCTRLVMFSAGLCAALTPFMISLAPEIGKFTWCTILGTNTLLVLSILREQNNK